MALSNYNFFYKYLFFQQMLHWGFWWVYKHENHKVYRGMKLFHFKSFHNYYCSSYRRQQLREFILDESFADGSCMFLQMYSYLPQRFLTRIWNILQQHASHISGQSQPIPALKYMLAYWFHFSQINNKIWWFKEHRSLELL